MFYGSPRRTVMSLALVTMISGSGNGWSGWRPGANIPAAPGDHRATLVEPRHTDSGVPEERVPDLAVHWVCREVRPEYRSLHLEAHIQNLGNVRSGHATLEMFVNGSVKSSWGQQALEPGERAQVNLGYHVSDADRQRGSVKLTIRLRPSGADRDPSNNEDSLDRAWSAGGDLDVRQVTLVPRGEGRFGLHASVVNAGDGSAASYRFTFRVLEPGTGREIFISRGRSEKRLAPGEYALHNALFSLPEAHSPDLLCRFRIEPEGPDATTETNSLESRPRRPTPRIRL